MNDKKMLYFGVHVYIDGWIDGCVVFIKKTLSVSKNKINFSLF